jgi:hypothetical protein
MEHGMRPQFTHPHNIHTVTFMNKELAEPEPPSLHSTMPGTEKEMQISINKNLYSAASGYFS